MFTKQSIELIIGLEKILGKGDLLAYLIHIILRIAEIFRVLKPTGSFYLHCDPTASHYLKLVLDSIFCAKGGDFKNEIIWCYKSGGATNKYFAKKHDIILYYTKSNKYCFNPQKEKSYMKPWSGKNPAQTYYKDDLGSFTLVNTKDWWQDIGMLSTDANERLGYPTQKPETLLERMISASTNESDIVLDTYCGCGTTVAVAERLNRNWIGVDITYQSISLILNRLEYSFGKSVLNDIEINGIPEDFESAVALAHKKEDKTRKEFEKWAVLTYSNNRAMINEKKGADAGIDGIAFMLDRNENNDTELKQVLFSVKSDKAPHVSYIRDLHGTIEREKATIGYFITLFPPTRDMITECKKIGRYKNNLVEQEYPKIEIVTVEDILNGNRITIPTSQQIAVIKSAQLKENNNQTKLEF